MNEARMYDLDFVDKRKIYDMCKFDCDICKIGQVMKLQT